MKRFVMILALLCPLGVSSLFAQYNSFFIGARTGVNTSQFKFTEDLKELYPNTNAVFGINGGFDAGLKFNNWTFSSGIHYVQKGSKYQTDNFEEGGETGFLTANEKLHFISIPLLVGYRDYLMDRVGYSVAIGPSFNFGLTGKLDEETAFFGSDDVDIQNFKSSFGESVNDDYKAQQVGFQITPGLWFEMNDRSKLTFNITWDFGTGDMFNPRYKDANDFFAENKGIQRHRTTMFSIGYEYHFNFEDKY